MSEHWPVELLVVDAGVSSADVLLNGRRPGVEVLVLTPGRGGLEQIAEHLADRHDVPSLHVLSHGRPGALLLAGDWVDTASLAVSADALAGIAASLAGNARVTLYGSSVAAGAAGLGFLDGLEAGLGAEVAASAGLVGALALGGGWTLRGRDGSTVEPVFSEVARAAYPGVLSAITAAAEGHRSPRRTSPPSQKR